MKRVAFRIGGVALVALLGLIAIARAQRGSDEPRPLETVPAANSSAEAPPAANPFAATTPPARATLPAEEPSAASVALKAAAQPAPAAPIVVAAAPNVLRAPAASRTGVPRPPVDADQDAETAPRQTIAPPATVASGSRVAVGERYAPAANPATVAASAPTRGSEPQYPTSSVRPPDGAPLQTQPRRMSSQEPAALPVETAAPLSAVGDARQEPGLMRTARNESPAAVRSSVTRTSATGDTVAAAEATGQPGRKQLEGPQVPQLTIQKLAPDGLQVGKPAVFRVTVFNTGQVAAHGVEVRDLVPRGTQLLATKPHATRGAGGELVWDLGTVKPGDEVSVEMQLMPLAEGEIGSVATVRFAADASARAIATKPELAVKVAAPGKVLLGETAVLSITVSNTGTGVATGVVLEERIPGGLQHPAGNELEYEIGALKPGESRQLQLPLGAARPGMAANVLVAKAEGNIRLEERTNIEIVAPQLDVAMEGPKKRYLERAATYTVSVSNPGTAPAKQVELVAYLPRGMKFVSANNAGQYEPATQTVHWVLEELPANDSGKVELTALPIEAGEQKLRLIGKADRGLSVEKEQPISVEGIAAVLFEVTDVNDPVEVGGETVYEIRVVNQGSKAASNVRIVALLPAALRPVAAEGPTRHTIEGNRVTFESLARLAPKADTTYRVRAQGLQPGDLRVRVQLLTDEMQEPVTKEESTRVYKDE